MTIFDVWQVLYYFGPAYAADVAPVVAANLLPRLDRPIDGGRTFRGRRLFGSHKTWRGLLAGLVAGVAVWEVQRAVYQWGLLRSFALVDYGSEPLVPGLLMGLGAGIGDALKSFFKRQRDIAPGSTWLVFDQIDFFLGALACVSLVQVPPLGVVLAVLPIVFVCDIAATALLWGLGLKETWL